MVSHPLQQHGGKYRFPPFLPSYLSHAFYLILTTRVVAFAAVGRGRIPEPLNFCLEVFGRVNEALASRELLLSQGRRRGETHRQHASRRQCKEDRR